MSAWRQSFVSSVLRICLLTGSVLASGMVAAQTEQPVEVNIAAQDLSSALTAFGRQTKTVIAFTPETVGSKQAPAVKGELPPPEVLNTLLADTGLEYRYMDDGMVIVRTASATDAGDDQPGKRRPASSPVLMAQNRISRNQQTASQTNRSERPSGRTNNKLPTLDEIIVTGTSIRGVIPESSPLQIYDAIDIRNTGAVTAEGFISTLTQNNNTLTAVGAGASAREDNTGENNAADLRGLGVGTTLVLLNGRRMAPSSGGRTADLSFIPLGAVDRVEVLTDGASAVYGADAVGGVINFVLKDRQDGAETVLGYGAVDGGREQLRISQSLGFNWADGNALIALSYFDQNSLDASDRDYSQDAAPRTLIGEDTRASVLATFTKYLPGDGSVSGDLLYSRREPRNYGATAVSGQFVEREYDNTQTVMNLAIGYPIGEKLDAELLVTLAEYAQERVSFTTNFGVPPLGPSLFDEDSGTLDLTAKLEGDLAHLRSGAIRFSLGAGYSEDEIERLIDSSLSVPGSIPTVTERTRDTRYVFAEIYAPIVSPKQAVPGIRRLELNLAARHTDFSDFGGYTNPKVGALWSPTESLTIRGTYSESIRAPFLLQLVPSGGSGVLFPPTLFGLPDIWSTDGSSVMLWLSGSGKQGLGPEEAKTYTFGFDFDLSALSISTTYYNIEYTDRIANPDPSNAALRDPQDFGPLLNLNPTIESITTILSELSSYNDFAGCFCELDPATVDPLTVQASMTVLYDTRIQNVAVSETDGVDLSIDYTMDALGGTLSFGANATKIFSYDQRAFAEALPTPLVDTLLFPADFKGRAYVGLQRDNWSAHLNVNYIDDYDNPLDDANPTVESWTTADLTLAYTIPTQANTFLGGIRFGLSIQNILDEDPPLVPVEVTRGTAIQFPIGFDPANANPFGRAVDFHVSKRW